MQSFSPSSSSTSLSASPRRGRGSNNHTINCSRSSCTSSNNIITNINKRRTPRGGTRSILIGLVAVVLGIQFLLLTHLSTLLTTGSSGEDGTRGRQPNNETKRVTRTAKTKTKTTTHTKNDNLLSQSEKKESRHTRSIINQRKEQILQSIQQEHQRHFMMNGADLQREIGTNYDPQKHVAVGGGLGAVLRHRGHAIVPPPPPPPPLKWQLRPQQQEQQNQQQNHPSQVVPRVLLLEHPPMLILPKPILLVGLPDPTVTASLLNYLACTRVQTTPQTTTSNNENKNKNKDEEEEENSSNEDDEANAPKQQQQSQQRQPMLLGNCMLHNLAATRPILEGCGEATATNSSTTTSITTSTTTTATTVFAPLESPRKVTAMIQGRQGILADNGTYDFSSTSNGQHHQRAAPRLFIPQHYNLQQLHDQYPHATWIFPHRSNVQEWINAILVPTEPNTKKQQQPSLLALQLVNEFLAHSSSSHQHDYFYQDDPTLPNKIKDIQELLNEFHEHHVRVVQDFVQQLHPPSHALIHFDPTSPETASVLSQALFGNLDKNLNVDAACWNPPPPTMGTKSHTATTTRDKNDIPLPPPPLAATAAQLQIPGHVDHASSSSSSKQQQQQQQQHTLAFLIPFRDSAQHNATSQGLRREENLNEWLQYMRRYLPTDLIDNSRVFVVEQTQDSVFNKGLLFNAGFEQIFGRSAGAGAGGDGKDHHSSPINSHTNDHHYTYMILHDVDQIPDARQSPDIYNYYDKPLKLIGSTTRRPSLDGEETIRHLSSSNVGGALLITPDAYRRVNGYSNNFGGWGKEDDNMAWRLRKGLKHEIVGGYKVLSNTKFRELYHDRVWGLDTNPQMKHNAAMERELVSGLEDVDYYEVVNVTHYSVDGWGVTRFLVEPKQQAAALVEPKQQAAALVKPKQHAAAARTKIRVPGPDKGPWIGNTCNALFAHNSTYWTYNGTCLNHRLLHWKSCHIGTLLVNTSRIIGSVGGEPLERVWNRSSAVEVLKFRPGALQLTTELDFLKRFYQDSGWTGALDNVITQGASTSTELERVTVQPAIPTMRPMTNLIVRRGDYANPCMTIATLYNVYLIVQNFKVVPPYRIVWLDGHAQGVLDPVWSQLFEGGEIIHMKQLSPSEQRLENTILVNVKSAFGDEGIKQHKFAHACDASSSTLEDFRNFVFNRYGIAHSDASNNEKGPSHKKLLTLLVRQHHRAHPRATGRTDRTLANVTADVQYLQSKYPNHQIDVVSFEDMSFEDQLNQIAKTDVFAAVHGAGNIHVVFLPHGATFVEYVPKGFSHRIRFKYLANCLNITYMREEARIVMRHVDKTMTVQLRPGPNNGQIRAMHHVARLNNGRGRPGQNG